MNELWIIEVYIIETRTWRAFSSPLPYDNAYSGMIRLSNFENPAWSKVRLRRV